MRSADELEAELARLADRAPRAPGRTFSQRDSDEFQEKLSEAKAALQHLLAYGEASLEHLRTSADPLWTGFAAKLEDLRRFVETR